MARDFKLTELANWIESSRRKVMSKIDKLSGTVLVVDDTPGNLRVLVDSLSNRGLDILVATDGKSAIERAAYSRPDLILLDVIMPGIDGFETCRIFKEKPETIDIPVIFMTALSDTSQKVKAFEVGAVDYVTKPFEEEELIARVDAHLTIRRLQDDLERRNDQLEDLNQLKNEFLGHGRPRYPQPADRDPGRIRDPRNDRGLHHRGEADPDRPPDPDSRQSDQDTPEQSPRRERDRLRQAQYRYPADRSRSHSRSRSPPITGRPPMKSRSNSSGKPATTKRIFRPITTALGSGAGQPDLQRHQVFRTRANGSGSNVDVKATVWLSPSSDEGPGLSAEDRGKLFGKFARLTPAQPPARHPPDLDCGS